MISKLRHLLKLHGQQCGTGDTSRSLTILLWLLLDTGSQIHAYLCGHVSQLLFLPFSLSPFFSPSLLLPFPVSPLFPPSFHSSLLLPSFLSVSSFLSPPPTFSKIFPAINDYFIIPPFFFCFFFLSPWINLQNIAFLYSLRFCSKPPSSKPDPSDTSPFSQGHLLLLFLKTLIIHSLCSIPSDMLFACLQVCIYTYTFF